MIRVKITKPQRRNPLIFLQEFSGLNVLRIIVLCNVSSRGNDKVPLDTINLTNCQWNCKRSSLSFCRRWHRSVTLACTAARDIVMG